MSNNNLIAQQIQTCNNLHQGALSILDIKDAVESGNFENANQMLSHLEDAINYTRIAVHGMQLIQEADNI